MMYLKLNVGSIQPVDLTRNYALTSPYPPSFTFRPCLGPYFLSLDLAFIVIILSTTLHLLKMLQNISFVKTTIDLEQNDK